MASQLTRSSAATRDQMGAASAANSQGRRRISTRGDDRFKARAVRSFAPYIGACPAL